MNRRTLGWAAVFLLAGTLLALGWFPGASSASLGPRVGLTALLLTFGVVLLVGSFAGLLRARTDRLDSKGCPVGATCGCGQFNFKPRLTCKKCGAATFYTT